MVASFALLLAACGGSPADSNATNAGDAPRTPAPSTGSSANAAAPSAPKDSRANDIDALVAKAGNINTDKESDAAPKKLHDDPPTTVTTAQTQFQCTSADYSLTKVPDKFVAMNPNADVLWPGSLVQGRSMAGGLLDPIPVERAPGKIVLTMASGSATPYFKDIAQPGLASATQAINDILSVYDAATPAKFSYQYSEVFSNEQLKVAVSADVKGTDWSAGASLHFDESSTKSHFLIQFTQEYYTMAFEPPKGAAGAFAPSVTADDVKPYVADGNPPVYVASVTYGRIFYLLFESDAKSTDLSAAVRGSFSVGAVEADAGASADYSKVVNNASVTAYGLGGNAADAIAAATGTHLGDKGTSKVDLINTFLTKGANFDKDHPGVPISYTIRYLGDSSEVKLALTTEYTAKDCTANPVGCDGVYGSGKQVDDCGTCGGSRHDGCVCPQTQDIEKDVYNNYNYHDRTNYAVFHITSSSSNAKGSVVSFSDGIDHEYSGWRCYRMGWQSVNFTCTDGSWVMSPAAHFWYDEGCTGDTNNGGGNNVSCGLQ